MEKGKESRDYKGFLHRNPLIAHFRYSLIALNALERAMVKAASTVTILTLV